MNMEILTASDVIQIHDAVIEPQEIQGLAPDKSIDAAIERPLNRAHYGAINNAYELAACYAVAIAQAHAFNDANKRTALQSMDIILDMNGIPPSHDASQAARILVSIIDPMGHQTEQGLAKWLSECHLT